MYKILFVCTGNICRSPTAEGVLREKLQQAGLADKVQVDSAGTHGYHIGEPPDSRSIKVAAAKGYSLQDQRARKFHASDYAVFDLILALDTGHLSTLQRHSAQNAKAVVALFCDYAGLGARDVPDPYYGDLQGFQDVLELIEDASDRLVEKLGRELGK